MFLYVCVCVYLLRRNFFFRFINGVLLFHWELTSTDIDLNGLVTAFTRFQCNIKCEESIAFYCLEESFFLSIKTKQFEEHLCSFLVHCIENDWAPSLLFLLFDITHQLWAAFVSFMKRYKIAFRRWINSILTSAFKVSFSIVMKLKPRTFNRFCVCVWLCGTLFSNFHEPTKWRTSFCFSCFVFSWTWQANRKVLDDFELNLHRGVYNLLDIHIYVCMCIYIFCS